MQTGVSLACETKPDQATLVPERREEITTEGGLDILANRDTVSTAIDRLRDAGITVSLFIDPDPDQIQAAAELGAEAVELHTGRYANANDNDRNTELNQLSRAGELVRSAGITLHAGHGLTYRNVQPVAGLAGMSELNIGHSIIARAIFSGLAEAVREMKKLVTVASNP